MRISVRLRKKPGKNYRRNVVYQTHAPLTQQAWQLALQPVLQSLQTAKNAKHLKITTDNIQRLS